MNVIVTQYKRPNGKKNSGEVEVPDNLKEKYLSIINCGCRITGEPLPEGQVAQYIEHAKGDVAIEISQPGKKAYESLCKMIKAFDVKEFEKWLKAKNHIPKGPPVIDAGLGIYHTTEIIEGV